MSKKMINTDLALKYGVSSLDELQNLMIADGYDAGYVKTVIKIASDPNHNKMFNATIINPDGTISHFGDVDYWQVNFDRIRNESNPHYMGAYSAKERLKRKFESKRRKSGQ